MATAPVLVFDSPKNRVTVFADHVEKVFHSGRGTARKARREVAALHALQGLKGVPSILAVGPDRRSVTMSRLHGMPLSECERVGEGTLVSLRLLVEQMLERGVARHSLPLRDVIVLSDGSAGLVDFERSTRRLFPLDPTWLMARAVTRFQMRRLVYEFAPELLTPNERRWLRLQLSMRAALQHPLKLRRRVARFVRARWSGA
jgi:hypothetical protein